MNWRGRPLTSHEVIVESIAATTTETGLTVHAELDTNPYPAGIQVSEDAIATVPITRHRFHGDWNCTLHPQHPMDTATTDSTSDQAPASRPPRLTRRSLQDPELTGMTRQQLSEQLIDALTQRWRFNASKCSAHVAVTSAWWPLAQVPKPSSPQPTGS
ncbi:hypothetical protein AB0D66_32600, partial [Streptomyces sp. NPDC048270]